MKRTPVAISSILKVVLENETKNCPTVFVPERIPDETVRNSMTYFVPLMEKAGLLRKVEAQADFEGFDCFRITWKGHCYLDLFDLSTIAASRGNSVEILLADIALATFH